MDAKQQQSRSPSPKESRGAWNIELGPASPEVGVVELSHASPPEMTIDDAFDRIGASMVEPPEEILQTQK